VSRGGLKGIARVSSGPGSRQDFATPWEFIRAVEKHFGKLDIDLAAHERNAKCARWFGPGGEEPDSLAVRWADYRGKRLWLNPIYKEIPVWAAKCVVEAQSGADVKFLVPASVGSNWFRDVVAPHSTVYYLNARIKFVGAKDVYPKDLLLAHFYRGARSKALIWNWVQDIIYDPWS
jgi:phage N-6-adenine-methyltransferase